jgi:hypothetical protein
VKWNAGDKPEDRQGIEVSETVIACKLSTIFALGQDERVNRAAETIVMPRP